MLLNDNERYSAYQKNDIIKMVSSLVVAITGNPNIEIIIANGETRSVADKLYLSELKSFEPHDIQLWRGYIDRAIFKIAYHDVICERKYCPVNPQASMLYSYLMRLRYELTGINLFYGSLVNLKAVYEQQSFDWDSSEGNGLYYAVKYLQPDLIDTFKEYNFNKEQSNIVPYLRYLRLGFDTDIETFADAALEFSIFMCDNSDDLSFIDSNQEFSQESNLELTAQKLEKKKSIDDAAEEKAQFHEEGDDDILDFFDDNGLENRENQNLNQSDNLQEGIFAKEDFVNDAILGDFFLKTEYKIYKNDYDKEINAEKLVSDKEKQQLIKEFVAAQKNQAKTIRKLARKLRSRLVSVHNDYQYFDLYEGVLDHHKINKILLEPLDGRFFKDNIPIIAENTAVTLLIDNSGSMRGKPITMAALCADIIAETIERCGAKVEILGFTTQEWRGGKSRKDYEKAGCPPMPGRLNDLYHIIYKDFNASYKNAKQAIPVMLKESLLKENIDGEALLWAVKRLLQRPQKRKILTVISDGAPVDDSTNSANHSQYLENHLKKVIYYYENKTDIDVFAIGIGHDVKNYYKKAVTISNSDSLAEALTERFVTLF